MRCKVLLELCRVLYWEGLSEPQMVQGCDA